MNKRAKTILSFSSVLPVLTLLVFLLVQPPAWAQSTTDPTGVGVGTDTTCIYAGLEYSVGSLIQGGCPDGQVQRCQSTGIWSSCFKP